MTLNYQEFEIFCKEFLSLSSTFGDQWIMKHTNSGENDFYLEKRCTVQSSKHSESNNMDEIRTLNQNSFHILVYHIVYSQSYSVPVLYFNAYHPNGSLLSLEDIWNGIPECYQNDLDHNKWNTITQQEHPKLGIPYYMVHPCYTADFMSSCSSSNYIVTWLSIVGPLVGLHLSLEYAKFIKPTEKSDFKKE